MKFQFYNQLPQDAKMIREKVFVEEQGFGEEFDTTDETCWHLVVYHGDEPIGCARMFPEDQQMIFGRIAVLKDKRDLHVGSQILEALEKKAKELGYPTVSLSAQVRVKTFYIKNGYVEYGEEYLDEHCPHIHMQKKV